MTISEEYQEALTEIHDNSEWGMSGATYAGATIVNLLETYPEIKTILDYGCGECTLKKYVEEQGIEKEWTLYDPGMREFSKKPEGTFDLVITTDVLEHVEPYMINAVLKELVDYSKDFLYNDIACYLTNVRFQSGPYIGQDLHISLKAPDDWGMRLDAFGFKQVANKTYLTMQNRLRYLSVLRK